MVFAGLTAVINGQEPVSIHQLELEAHRDVVIDYETVDSLARSLPPPLVKVLQPDREVIGYLPYWKYDSYLTLNYNYLTQINYFSAELETDGTISDSHHWASSALVNFAHARGVKVKLCVTMFGRSNLETFLSSTSSRQRAIDNLVSLVKSVGADGIDIDFELMPEGYKSSLVTFMSNLTQRFRSEIPGSIITMATPAVDWSNHWDYNALANIVDYLFIMGYAYHWDGSTTAGPTSPLDGFSKDVRWTVADYLSKTPQNADKIVLGIPYYGYDWPVSSTAKYASTTARGSAILYASAYVRAQTNGRIWDSASSTPYYNYQSGGNHQVWYDDSLSLSLKYQHAIANDLGGVGMWALGYDDNRPELWGALADHFSGGQLPEKPVTLAAVNQGDGSIRVQLAGVDPSDYALLVSTDGRNFTSEQQRSFPDFTIDGLSDEDLHYFQVRETNTMGAGEASEVLVTSPADIKSSVLLVNGFDRTEGTDNRFNYVRQYAPHLFDQGIRVDAASNEAVETGWIDLNQYAAVFWILGEEGTVHSTFTRLEQAAIKRYLELGGNLFVSGSEIGYDLVAEGSDGDRRFYTDYLKARYVSDDATAGGFMATAAESALFDGLGAIPFDNGTHGTYNVDWPDGILPAGGAEVVLTYAGVDTATGGAAGIAYHGPFGNSAIDGRLIYLAFGFEAVYQGVKRITMMERVIDYFALQTDQERLTSYAIAPNLGQNYPNPFTTYTAIPYSVRTAGQVQLLLYNIRGQLVRNLVAGHQLRDEYLHYLYPNDGSGRPLAAGIYLVVLNSPGQSLESRKLTYIK